MTGTYVPAELCQLVPSADPPAVYLDVAPLLGHYPQFEAFTIQLMKHLNHAGKQLDLPAVVPQ